MITPEQANAARMEDAANRSAELRERFYADFEAQVKCYPERRVYTVDMRKWLPLGTFITPEPTLMHAAVGICISALRDAGWKISYRVTWFGFGNSVKVRVEP